jgi:hypothetical protein
MNVPTPQTLDHANPSQAKEPNSSSSEIYTWFVTFGLPTVPPVSWCCLIWRWLVSSVHFSGAGVSCSALVLLPRLQVFWCSAFLRVLVLLPWLQVFCCSAFLAAPDLLLCWVWCCIFCPRDTGVGEASWRRGGQGYFTKGFLIDRNRRFWLCSKRITVCPAGTGPKRSIVLLFSLSISSLHNQEWTFLHLRP